MFQILHHTFVDGWTNVSHDEDGQSLMFETYAEAADELRDLFESMDKAGMEVDVEDYVITDDESNRVDLLRDDDIDAHVRLYCCIADITVDGDIFGHYFQGEFDPANGLTPAQIEQAVTDAATTFNLYR